MKKCSACPMIWGRSSRISSSSMSSTHADVEPMAQVLYDADETATLREDVPHTPLSNHEALANAPASGAGYFKVPKVIER